MPASSDSSFDLASLARLHDDADSESQLLEQTSFLLDHDSMSSASASRTGHGGADLSLSELSLDDKTVMLDKPFSLLAPVSDDSDAMAIQSDGEEGLGEGGEMGNNQKQSSKAREDKLQSDIFILRKLNSSFAVFDDALKDVGTANEV